MGNVDRFEERLALLRQARARRRGAARKLDVAQTKTLPDGSSVSVLAPETTQPDGATIALEAKRLAKELQEKLFGGTQS